MSVNPPRLAMIIGSTRPTRFAEKPATWLASVAAERDDLTLETLDLRDFDLPYFAEVGSNLHVPTEDPAALGVAGRDPPVRRLRLRHAGVQPLDPRAC